MSDIISSISSLANKINPLNRNNPVATKKNDYNNLIDELSGKTHQPKEIIQDEIAALIDIEQMACLPE